MDSRLLQNLIVIAKPRNDINWPRCDCICVVT